MEEIEVKILEIEKQNISDKILSLGGNKLSENIIIDVFFDYPDESLSKKGSILRLRKAGDSYQIAYKYKKEKSSEFKIMEELETEISDGMMAENIIKELGMMAVRHVEKKRTSFVLDEIKLEIDEYPGIPPLLEIEAKDRKAIKKVIEDLGLSAKDTEPISNRKVFEKYNKNPDDARF